MSSGDKSLTEIEQFTVSGSLQYADSPASAAPEVVFRSSAEDDFHRYSAAVDKDGTFIFQDLVFGMHYALFSDEKGQYVSDVSVDRHSEDGAPVVVDGSVYWLSLIVVAKSA